MLTREGTFLWSRNPENRLPDERSKGKWLIYGSYARLRRQLTAIDGIVDAHGIYRAKLIVPHAKENPLPGMPPTLLVYADNPTRYQTLDLLLANGIVPSAWNYNWETRRDWDAGGPLDALYRRLSRDDQTLRRKEMPE